MPRFVVLFHDWPTPHYDLMLEDGGVLKTWRLKREPIGINPIPAEPIGDHRLAYLDYEGSLTGNRGTVTRWDTGELKKFEVSDGMITVEFDGARLQGERLLTQLNAKNWVLL